MDRPTREVLQATRSLPSCIRPSNGHAACSMEYERSGNVNILITPNKRGVKMADMEKKDPAETPARASETGNEGAKSQEYMSGAGGGPADRGSNEAGEEVNRYQDP